MILVYPINLMPHLNPPTGLLLPLSSPCIFPKLKISKPYHKKSNFNTCIRVQIQECQHPNQEPKHPTQEFNYSNQEPKHPNQEFNYSNHSIVNDTYPEDSTGNLIPIRPRDPTVRNYLLLSLSLNLREKIIYLDLLGVDPTKSLRDNPSVLYTSLYSMKNVVDYLQQMGMLYEDMGKIFGMCPQILTFNTEKDLVPVFSFLIDEVKIRRKDIRKCIRRCPKLLTCSVRDQLRPTLYYLKKLGCVIDCSSTVLLASSVEKSFVPKLEYVQSLGISYKDAVKMVVRAPGILSCNVENNLQPKFDFLINEMGGKVEDLLKFPHYFGFSLEKRIKPRHELLVKYNVCFPLSDMLIKTDKDFLNRLKQLAG